MNGKKINDFTYHFPFIFDYRFVRIPVLRNHTLSRTSTFFFKGFFYLNHSRIHETYNTYTCCILPIDLCDWYRQRQENRKIPSQEFPSSFT